MVRLGNASAPRWYDCSLTVLDRFVEELRSWGAASTELVLHDGASDIRTARVHVLRDDWWPVFERYRAAGFVCHAHASLLPEYGLDCWSTDKSALQARYRPLLDTVSAFGQRQGATSVLVVHGAGRGGSTGDPEDATRHFLAWAATELRRRGDGASIAIELRRAATADDGRPDRSRLALERCVRDVGDERVGICWDVAHDWENGHLETDWSVMPGASFLSLVRHVHVHDAAEDRSVHAPLRHGRVPWREMLAALRDGYDGDATLEVRYRLALALGEPWSLLRESFDLARGAVLDVGARQETTGATFDHE